MDESENTIPVYLVLAIPMLGRRVRARSRPVLGSTVAELLVMNGTEPSEKFLIYGGSRYDVLHRMDVIMSTACYTQTGIGRIGIVEEEDAITQVLFPDEKMPSNVQEGSSKLLREAEAQLLEYLSSQRTDFDLPLATRGTEFMGRVWNALTEIPFGETRSYTQIAQAVGRSKAARAVGMACRRNPLPIFIPCHRVVGASGAMVGFLGGIHMKEHLLRLERDAVL